MHWPHFADEDTEAQRDAVPCPVELGPHGRSTACLSEETSPSLGLTFPSCKMRGSTTFWDSTQLWSSGFQVNSR